MKPEVLSIVLESVQHVAEVDRIDPGVLGPDTPLFGRKGMLDSLSLVRLLVAVEQDVEERFGVSITLSDDRAMSQRSSPFRTVGSLADYATVRIAENA